MEATLQSGTHDICRRTNRVGSSAALHCPAGRLSTLTWVIRWNNGGWASVAAKQLSPHRTQLSCRPRAASAPLIGRMGPGSSELQGEVLGGPGGSWGVLGGAPGELLLQGSSGNRRSVRPRAAEPLPVLVRGSVCGLEKCGVSGPVGLWALNAWACCSVHCILACGCPQWLSLPTANGQRLQRLSRLFHKENHLV